MHRPTLTVSRTSVAADSEEHPGGDLATKPLGDLGAAFLEGVREDHGELVAAEAGHQIDLPELRPELAGQLEEDAVAHPMAVAVR